MTKSFVRAEVLAYLKAGIRLLEDRAGSHGDFRTATKILRQKGSPYTERELVLVQELVRRLSNKCGEDEPASRPYVNVTRPLPALRLV